MNRKKTDNPTENWARELMDRYFTAENIQKAINI